MSTESLLSGSSLFVYKSRLTSVPDIKKLLTGGSSNKTGVDETCEFDSRDVATLGVDSLKVPDCLFIEDFRKVGKLFLWT